MIVASELTRPLLRSAIACTLATSLAAWAEEPFTFTAPVRLSATPAKRNIDLSWQNTATAPGGCWIEFSTPGDDFTKLDAVWPETTTFRHPDVIPETKFIYRVLPFFGRPSAEAELSTGTILPGDVETKEEGPLPEVKSGAVVNKTSIRSAATFADAMADGLTAKLSFPTSAELRWNDHSTDEDGFLVEIAAADERRFRLCALLPPDTTSFRKIQLPSGTKCRFRVRAFFYGEPSKSVPVLTPPAPLPRKD